MRASLVESLASGHGREVQHPKGSVILCCACLVPLYVLQRSLFSGDTASRSVDAYRPLQLTDVQDLMDRLDAPAIAALVKHWTPEQRASHCAHIPEVRTGAAALCPACGRSWVRVRAVEAQEVIDRAYVWELVTLLPREPIPGQVYRAWAIPQS